MTLDPKSYTSLDRLLGDAWAEVRKTGILGKTDE